MEETGTYPVAVHGAPLYKSDVDVFDERSAILTRGAMNLVHPKGTCKARSKKPEFKRKPWILRGVQLGESGLYHFSPKRIPRNLDVMRNLKSRTLIDRNLRIRHALRATSRQVKAIWESFGSGLNHDLSVEKIARILDRIRIKYDDNQKSFFTQKSGTGVAVERINKLNAEIFFPASVTPAKTLPLRSKKALPFPDMRVKPSVLTVPTFSDLYDGNKTLYEWSGATVTPDLYDAYGLNMAESSSLHASIIGAASAITFPQENDAENDEGTEDDAVDEGNNFCHDATATKSVEHHEARLENMDICAHFDDRRFRTVSRDTSTQTNLIIPSDIIIPDGKNVRVRFVFEDAD